jgi:hypothetical protein
MSLITENGQGLANAESYCSVADATTYHGGRGNADAWDAIDDKEAALRKATDFMLQRYRAQWKGQRNSTTQALDWPRQLVVIDDMPNGYGAYAYYLPNSLLPVPVANACAELALKTASGALMADLGRETRSESVGPISVTYEPGSSRQTAYAAVYGILRPYLKPAGQLSVARA